MKGRSVVIPRSLSIVRTLRPLPQVFEEFSVLGGCMCQVVCGQLYCTSAGAFGLPMMSPEDLKKCPILNLLHLSN